MLKYYLKFFIRSFFIIVLWSVFSYASFDNGGNPGDSNGNCPGETIPLNASGPSPFVGNGNVDNSNNDWADKFKFTIPVSGTVTVTLSSNTDVDFKMATYCGGQNIVRYDDSHTDVKTYSFSATAGTTYYITIFDGQWRGQSNPYTLTIDYPTNGGGGSSCEDYDSNNDGCPGRIITSMDQITTSKSTCITGISRNNEGSHKNDYYRFQVQTNGTLRIRGTSPNNHEYYLRVGSSCGGTQYYGDTRSKNHDTGDISLHTGDTIYIKAKETGNDDDQYRLNLNFTADNNSGTPPIMNDVPDMTVNVGDSVSLELSSYVTKTEGDSILEYSLTGTLPNGVTFNSNTGSISGTANESGDFTLSAKARDNDGWSNSDSWTIHVNSQSNIPPIMKDIPDQDARYDTSFSLNLNDYVTKTDGDNITNYHLSGTLPSGISFNSNNGIIDGTPNDSSEINHQFDLEVWVTDKDGDSNHVTFSIKVTPKDTQVTIGDIEFHLVNPKHTRNLAGDYIIIGNTVECHTPDGNQDIKYYQANQSCADNYYGNNGHNTNYIDIDNDPHTWNSTSANFNLPDNAKIVWVGLFWQGNINNRVERHFDDWISQRYARPTGNSLHGPWEYVYNYGTKYEMDLDDTSANRALVKIGNGNYIEVQANELGFSKYFYHSPFGGAYAAWADVTSIFKKQNLTPGKHTVTIANITATHGMDGNWLGDYGGWSMAIIFTKPEENVKNISIYSGFTQVKNPHGLNPSKKIIVDGFKLPKKGIVNAHMSVFSGEGEYNNHGDTMKINGKLMPGINKNDKYNVFDEIMTPKVAEARNATPWYNKLKYACTIDVDDYDVSEIMTQMRDNNPDTHSVTLEAATNQAPLGHEYYGEHDAFFPSMISLSTDLYIPAVCYDYSIKLGKYINIDSKDRNFTANNLGNVPLQLKIMIRSEESDFDLLDSKLNLEFRPDNVFKYKQGFSKYSLPNTNIYLDAIETDVNKGEIAIGSNPTTDGGIIGSNESIYAKLYYDFKKEAFKDGIFDINLNTKISFDGINKISYTLSTLAPKDAPTYINRCETNPVYDPIYGMFNIERGDSKFYYSEEQKDSLYTQVVGAPYQISIASYKKSILTGKYNVPNIFINTTVELELIDADTFENNSSAGFDSVCSDPDIQTAHGIFVKLNKSRVKLNVPNDFHNINGKETYPKNLAIRNAAFRVWYLTKKSGNNRVLVNNNCNSQYDSSCFDKLYKDNYSGSDTHCSSQCKNSSGSRCYECLKQYYATPICSRDNFAIRPESYKINLGDNNETVSNTIKNIGNNSSGTNLNLSAGYLYRLDINATKYNDNVNKTDGYFFSVLGDKGTKKAITQFNDKTTCEDKNDHDLNIDIINGKTIGYESLSANPNTPQNGLIINNSGKYKVHLEDKEWTLVDQQGYIYKPFKNHADCIANSNIINNGLNSQKGCDIISDYNPKYYDLNVNMHPYSFKLDSMVVDSNPNSSANYLYINDLNTTKHLIQNDDVIAIKINGNISALGKNDTLLSNYTNNCSANDINIKLNYKTYKNGTQKTIVDDLNNTITPNYSLYVKDIDSSVNVKSANATSTAIDVNFPKKYFSDSSTVKGKAKFALYFNYKRDYNAPVNPFDIHFSIFDLKSPLDKSSVDMYNNYIPNAKKDLNTSKTFYYAKARSLSDFYDDINTQIIKTPIMITIFCNEKLEYCEKYNINTAKMQTSEYDWWVAKEHSSTLKEGQVELTTQDTSKATVNPTIVKDFTNGIDKEVKVQDVGITNRPYIVKVKPTNSMKSNYPWLLFNKFENKAPEYLYKVRFVDIPAAWSGQGKTGHTIDVKASGRKNKKINW